MSTSVCEKCRRKKACPDYGNYLQPSLFPGIARIRVTKPKYRFADKSRLIEAHVGTLENGEDVLISGFGKFCVKGKGKRKGRNPHTGDDLLLGARKVVTFKCSSVLRDEINKQ